MTHFWTVFGYEFRRNLRRNGYLFTSFLLPLILLLGLLLYVTISSGQSAERTSDAEMQAEALREELNLSGEQQAGYIDLTGTFGAPDAELAALFTPYPDEAAARAALDAGEISVYYRIEPDYLETGNVTIVQSRLNFSLISRAPVNALVLRELSQGVPDDVYRRLVSEPTFNETNLSLSDPQGTNFDTSFVIVYVFAIMLIFSLLITNGYLLQSVIEEKETRLVEILLTSVRPLQLLGGKVLALGILGLLQVAVWVIAMYLAIRIAGGAQLEQAAGLIATIANLRFPTEALPFLLIYFVLGYLVFAGLYAVVGAMSNSMKEGPQYAALLSIPASAPLYFLPVILEDPNSTVAVILSIFPLTSPVTMVQRLVISPVPAWQLALSIGLMVLATAGAMWLAGRVFRVQALLAGQGIRFRDLPRLVRG